MKELVEFLADVGRDDEDDSEDVSGAQEYRGAENPKGVLEHPLVNPVAQQPAKALGEILVFVKALDHGHQGRARHDAAQHGQDPGGGELFGATQGQMGQPK